MGKIIAVVNQKGGVGKTTTAVNLTAALHDLGLKVLLCDFDPQANATSGLGLDKRKIKYSVYDVTINGVPAAEAIAHTKYGDVLPSTADLAGAAVELISAAGRERQLAQALEQVKDQYDVILVDCPPSLELLTLNALCAADSILVPLQCCAEEYVFRGLVMQAFGSWIKLPVIAIILQSLVFAATHPYNIVGVISVALMGTALGVCAYITNGLEASCAAHIVNNMITFLFTGFGFGAVKTDVDVISTVVVICCMCLYIAFLVFAKKKLINTYIFIIIYKYNF